MQGRDDDGGPGEDRTELLRVWVVETVFQRAEDGDACWIMKVSTGWGEKKG